MRTAVPTTRPKKAEITGRIQIRVPKMTGDDMNHPDAEIHRYVGEDSPFKSGEIKSQTPRMFVVEMDAKEGHDYNQACIDESKARLPKAERNRSFATDFTLVNPTNSQAAMAQMMMPNQVQDDSDDG